MAAQANTPIQAVQTAFEILGVLVEQDGVGVTEIAREQDVSKSTVHRHLSTLRDAGIVIKDGDRYYLSANVLKYGEAARARHGSYPLAKPVVDSLADETNEGAALAVGGPDHITYLYRSWSPREVSTDLRLGHAYPEYHCSAAGKALLASFPTERVEEILDAQGMAARTPNTLTNKAELFAELETIRSEGVAFDDEERHEGIRGVAKVIKDRDNDRTLGAITVHGPAIRVNGETFREEIPTLLRRAVSMIEVDYINPYNHSRR